MAAKIHLFAWPTAAVLVLDQLTKAIVVRTLAVHETVPVIPGWFNLVHVRNRGMAFGFLNRGDAQTGFFFLVAATIAAVVVLVIWFLRLPAEERKVIFGISLVLGGALGNLLDRIRLREVVDFLDFHVGQLHWPAFNVADSAITVGTLWVALILFFARSRPDRRK